MNHHAGATRASRRVVAMVLLRSFLAACAIFCAWVLVLVALDRAAEMMRH